MRYLNKIVFINSANIAYAEIGIAGNVHFIGTQGVGKSTCLRAILFFYNADKLRLGIEKGKRSFDDYYLPHGNSFIVYEVVTETGAYCVLAYKSQGRAAFRFIDGAYDRNNFIGQDNKAMVWDKVRNTFSGVAAYSRKVERYEEYRDILYGNNRGLQPQFKKYALIESKSYQNLPRTIQNVFLNSKLEAEFIKQTIIMSLNEEDVSIDLDQYALHLKNFEQQLADIGKWTEKNKSGEIVVRLLAANISSLHKTLGFLSNEKQQLLQTLISSHAALEQAHPGLVKRLDQQREKKVLAVKKVEEADDKFGEKKGKIVKEINLMDARLSDARRKSEDYQRINITGIIERVAKRSSWENKKANIQAERDTLSFLYQEITNKYAALLLQLRNQLDQFINEKNSEGNDRKSASYRTKDDVRRLYEKIASDIELEHADIKVNAQMLVNEKKDAIHRLELKKKEAELKRWFELEISTENQLIADADQKLLAIKTEKTSSKSLIESLQKSWSLDEKSLDVDFLSQRNRFDEQIAKANTKIEEYKTLIASSRNSLYEWLHENKPGWEDNIGKVINQQSVLFKSGLSPKHVSVDANLFYGIELDLSSLESDVKSIADYEQEIKQLGEQIIAHQTSIASLAEQQVAENEKLKRKYQPQIKTQKDLNARREYDEIKLNERREKSILDRDDWRRKSETEQKAELANIKAEILQAGEEKLLADEHVQTIEKNIKKQLDDKRRERDQKLSAEDRELSQVLEAIKVAVDAEKIRVEIRKKQISGQEKEDLEKEGADVKRITEIEVELVEINKELDYIDSNRDRVAEYNKDKRELFDHVDDFKSTKKLAEGKLSLEQERHENAKLKLQEGVNALNLLISVMEVELREMTEDLEDFENFSKTDVYLMLSADTPILGKQTEISLRLTRLIASIYEKVNESSSRMNELRGNVNKFLSNFSAGNIFGFETSLADELDYLRFAENLSEFLEENKIDEYEKRTNELFSALILQVGKETTELVSKEHIISKVISDINRDFMERNFAGVIREIELRMSQSMSKLVVLLQEIRIFNDEYAASLGGANLFSNSDSAQNNKKAVSYLKSFAAEITASKQSKVTLSDTFELQFKIVENDNDSGWVEKLTNVGSEGTDVLVKAMINIMLLNVFKENASRKFKDFRLHCMMDEIGKLHPNNVRGILKFANDRNIVLINSSPTSYNAVDYKHTYLLNKDSRHATVIKRLITNNVDNGN